MSNKGNKRDMQTIQRLCHKIATEKGFWDGQKVNFNVSEKLMLVVTELGEACEALRINKRQIYSSSSFGCKCKKPEYKKEYGGTINERMCGLCGKPIFGAWEKDTFEDELADAIIRILDLAERMGIDMDWQIWNKLDYNKKRPYRHGKKF